MEKYYRIAGLTVKMDSFGRTVEQAVPYEIEPCDPVDITITWDWRKLQEKYPKTSDDICEYLLSGSNFYTYLLNFDGLLLHSSAVVMDGKAYLFTADCGTGKSTHTQLWLKRFGDRAFILNDDKPALRLEDGVWYAYGTPWSGKHDISVNTRMPLGGIAVVNRCDTNWLEPMDAKEAVFNILRQTTQPREMSYRIKLLELLDKLITQIPVWKLHCNMDMEAAVVAYETMSGNQWRNTMKLKEGFILRQVAGETVVIPSGDDLDLNMMITLNDTGKFIWERLEKGTDEDTLVADICAEYEVDADRARTAVCNFVEKLVSHGFLEN